MNEVLIFPLRNEQGFKADSSDSYLHMIRTIVHTQIELQEDYPGYKIMVVYEVNND